GLLAHVLVSKYADHLPLYRQSGILLRHGVTLARSTLCQWVGQCVGLLSPIVTAMKQDILQSKVIQTDDTPVRVLDPGSGKTLQGRLWAYLGDKEHASAVFDFSMTRQQCWPKAFLGDFSSYLQADAYTGYDQLFTSGKAGGKMIEVGCWAHGRRKFFEAKDTDRERSRWAVDAIRRLYQVEWDARDLDATARKALRQERSSSILDEIHAWLKAQSVRVLPKAPMGEAIYYALAQWKALNRYLEDGDLAIDNNACERLLRGACLGRKNYLFFGSEEGGRWAAVLYSLVESCKLRGIDPFVYLKDVLVRTSTHPQRRVLELTPRLWKPPPEVENTS
ncbi:MAG: IS66 family transposase, partial [candidate division NC10 bacterium]